MMTRIRTVKPDLFMHEDLFDAERETGLPLRLAFIGLFTCCDKAGRFRWKPRRLKLHALPYDEGVSMDAVLEALWLHGFLVKYESEGEVYGCIPTWERHQCVNHREAESEYPEPTVYQVKTGGEKKKEASQAHNETFLNRQGTSSQETQGKQVQPKMDPELQQNEQKESIFKETQVREGADGCASSLSNEGKSSCPGTPGCVQRSTTLCDGVKLKDNLQQRESKEEKTEAYLNNFESVKDKQALEPTASSSFEEKLNKKDEKEVLHREEDTFLPDRLDFLCVLEADEKEKYSKNNKLNKISSKNPSLTLIAEPPCPGMPGRAQACPGGTGKGTGKGKGTGIPLCRVKPRPGEQSENKLILMIFEHWQQVMQHPNAKLDPKRIRWIKTALHSGYSSEQLCQAITGCSLTPHNQGDNERGQRYDGLHVILRDADQIDRFIRNAEHPPHSKSKPQDAINAWLASKQIHEGVTYDTV